MVETRSAAMPHRVRTSLAATATAESLITEPGVGWETALGAKATALAGTSLRPGLTILHARSVTEAAASPATLRVVPEVLRTESAKTKTAAMHHRARTSLATTAAAESLTAKAGAEWKPALRAKATALAGTSLHPGLTVFHSRSATKAAASTAALGVVSEVLGAKSAETRPAATHHGLPVEPAGSTLESAPTTTATTIALREPALAAETASTTMGSAGHERLRTLSAAATPKPLAGVGARCRLDIIPRAEPAHWAGTATHPGLASL